MFPTDQHSLVLTLVGVVALVLSAAFVRRMSSRSRKAARLPRPNSLDDIRENVVRRCRRVVELTIRVDCQRRRLSYNPRDLDVVMKGHCSALAAYKRKLAAAEIEWVCAELLRAELCILLGQMRALEQGSSPSTPGALLAQVAALAHRQVDLRDYDKESDDAGKPRLLRRSTAEVRGFAAALELRAKQLAKRLTPSQSNG